MPLIRDGGEPMLRDSGDMAAMTTTRQEAEGGLRSAPGAAGWLRLAATPSFALMALLTGLCAGGQTDMLCPAGMDASMLRGMVPMYLLMSLFHAGPWLALRFGRRRS